MNEKKEREKRKMKEKKENQKGKAANNGKNCLIPSLLLVEHVSAVVFAVPVALAGSLCSLHCSLQESEEKVSNAYVFARIGPKRKPYKLYIHAQVAMIGLADDDTRRLASSFSCFCVHTKCRATNSSDRRCASFSYSLLLVIYE